MNEGILAWVTIKPTKRPRIGPNEERRDKSENNHPPGVISIAGKSLFAAALEFKPQAPRHKTAQTTSRSRNRGAAHCGSSGENDRKCVTGENRKPSQIESEN
jgi:hypothetical protein